MGGGDFPVTGIGADALHSAQIKALHIQQRLKAAGVEHVHHIAGDAAQAIAALDALFQHDVLQIFGRGQRSAAGTGLEAHAVFQQAGMFDDFGGILSHHQAHRVTGDLGGARNDARRVADALHLHHIIHIGLADGEISQRIRHQVVGDDDHFFGIHGIGKGIAQAAAGRFAVFAGAVAHGVGSGRCHKGHIDGAAALLDVAGASAMGAEGHRFIQHAVGDGPAHHAADVVGFQASDHMVFDMPDEGLMGVEHRGRIHIQVFDPQVGHSVHDHVEHIVTVAQMMVEGDRHAVFQPGQLDCLLDGGNHFGIIHR